MHNSLIITKKIRQQNQPEILDNKNYHADVISTKALQTFSFSSVN